MSRVGLIRVLVAFCVGAPVVCVADPPTISLYSPEVSELLALAGRAEGDPEMSPNPSPSVPFTHTVGRGATWGESPRPSETPSPTPHGPESSVSPPSERPGSSDPPMPGDRPSAIDTRVNGWIDRLGRHYDVGQTVAGLGALLPAIYTYG